MTRLEFAVMAQKSARDVLRGGRQRGFGSVAGPSSVGPVPDASSTKLPSTKVPVPIALGGLGLLLAFFTPSGLIGWQGFVLGFVAGIVALWLAYSGEASTATQTRGLMP